MISALLNLYLTTYDVKGTIATLQDLATRYVRVSRGYKALWDAHEAGLETDDDALLRLAETSADLQEVGARSGRDERRSDGMQCEVVGEVLGRGA